MSKKLGDLKLTDKEEDQIAEFLKTLTDGYTRPYPDANAYTGGLSRKALTAGAAPVEGVCANLAVLARAFYVNLPRIWYE